MINVNIPKAVDINKHCKYIMCNVLKATSISAYSGNICRNSYESFLPHTKREVGKNKCLDHKNLTQAQSNIG